MAHAIFAFRDTEAGHRAVERLRAIGIPEESLVLHTHEGRPHEKTLHDADEQITGGLLSNLYGLFEGVFAWGSAQQESQPYVDLLQRGGSVLAVDSPDAQQQSLIDGEMAAAGAMDRSHWGVHSAPLAEQAQRAQRPRQ